MHHSSTSEHPAQTSTMIPASRPTRSLHARQHNRIHLRKPYEMHPKGYGTKGCLRGVWCEIIIMRSVSVSTRNPNDKPNEWKQKGFSPGSQEGPGTIRTLRVAPRRSRVGQPNRGWCAGDESGNGVIGCFRLRRRLVTARLLGWAWRRGRYIILSSSSICRRWIVVSSHLHRLCLSRITPSARS